MDEAAMKSYATLLLQVRGQLHDALAIYRKLLLRRPSEASKEILELATSDVAAGKPLHAEGLLRLLLDVPACNASHPRASWEIARLLMAREAFSDATQLYLQGFIGGYGSTSDLLEVAHQLHTTGNDGRAEYGRGGNGGPEGEGGESGGVVRADVAQEGHTRCLKHAQRVYAFVIERDSSHAQCALQLAVVTYRLMLSEDAAVATSAAASTTIYGSRGSPDSFKYGNSKSILSYSINSNSSTPRPIQGMWGDVVKWLRHALQCDGGRYDICDSIFALGVQMEKEGQVRDAATVLSLVAEMSNYSHSPSILRSASLLHHHLADLDAAADMYACAVHLGVADADMFIGYAHLLEFHDMDPRAALECYQAAEILEMGNPNLKILAPMARLLHLQGDLELALVTYTKALVVSADMITLQTLRGEGRSGGIAACNEPSNAQQIREMQRSLQVGYGDVLRAKGIWREAEDAYLAVLQDHPKDTQAQLGLLFMLLDSGEDADTAQVLLSRLVEADVSDARLWLEHGKQLTCALEKLVNEDDVVFQEGVQKAIRAFEKSAVLDPHNSLVWVEMARLETCNGKMPF